MQIQCWCWMYDVAVYNFRNSLVYILLSRGAVLISYLSSNIRHMSIRDFNIVSFIEIKFSYLWYSFSNVQKYVNLAHFYWSTKIYQDFLFYHFFEYHCISDKETLFLLQIINNFRDLMIIIREGCCFNVLHISV